LIRYVTGDAATPIAKGTKIIAHVTNDTGGWGRGFVAAISRKWKAPEWEYRTHPEQRILGTNQYVQVEKDIWVANMCAQHGYSSRSKPALNYPALERCLELLAAQAEYLKASIHCPRIGCGLGGGDWERVYSLMSIHLRKTQVTVYEL